MGMSISDAELPLGAEQIPAGEHEAICRIVEIERQMLQKQIDRERLPGSGKPVPRGQHAKQHGCVKADFAIADDLPAALRWGVFQQPGSRFLAWIRFSNARAQDDRMPDGHGMAIKLMGVSGQKLLEGQEHEQTQDFLLIDHPVFFVKNALEFADFEAALLEMASADSWLSLEKLSLAKYFLTRPQELLIVAQLATHLPSNPLEERYWSATPYQLGPQAVKYSVMPRGGLTPIAAPKLSANHLRESMKCHLATTAGASFDVFVQPQVDSETTPIEDATREWEEKLAPSFRVATIHVPPQVFDNDEQMQFGENLSLNPWHCLPEHRPLGGINRLRKAVYSAMSDFRHKLNNVRSSEPTPETRLQQVKFGPC
jgi:catalase